MRWFVIYSEIGHEFEAWANLAMRGFGVYMPLATRVRRKPLKTSKTPLLARYLFVNMDEGASAEQLARLRAARGVQEMLPHDQDPQPLSSWDVRHLERLQRAEASGEFVFSDTATGKKKEKKTLRSFQELAKELAIHQIPGQSC